MQTVHICVPSCARMVTFSGIFLTEANVLFTTSKIMFLFFRTIPLRLFFISGYQTLWFFSHHFSANVCFIYCFLLAYVEDQCADMVVREAELKHSWLDQGQNRRD